MADKVGLNDASSVRTTASRVETVREQTATYVRFEDTEGNPLPARNVVIKVDAGSGEIIDIVSEA